MDLQMNGDVSPSSSFHGEAVACGAGIWWRCSHRCPPSRPHHHRRAWPEGFLRVVILGPLWGSCPNHSMKTGSLGMKLVGKVNWVSIPSCVVLGRMDTAHPQRAQGKGARGDSLAEVTVVDFAQRGCRCSIPGNIQGWELLPKLTAIAAPCRHAPKRMRKGRSELLLAQLLELEKPDQLSGTGAHLLVCAF